MVSFESKRRALGIISEKDYNEFEFYVRSMKADMLADGFEEWEANEILADQIQAIK